MKRTTAIAAAAILTIAGFALAGCSAWLESPAKPANDAIAVANTHLKNAATIEAEVASQGDALQKLAYTKEGSAEALKITAAVTASLKEERGELDAAKAAVDGIAKLEVDAPFKEYAKLESAAIDARIAVVDADSRLYDALDRLYSSFKTSSTVDNQDIILAIDQMRLEVSTQAETATQAAQEAADYFTANKLGG